MASEDSTHVETRRVRTSAGGFEYSKEVRLRQLLRGRCCAVVVLIIIEDMQYLEACVQSRSRIKTQVESALERQNTEYSEFVAIGRVLHTCNSTEITVT